MILPIRNEKEKKRKETSQKQTYTDEASNHVTHPECSEAELFSELVEWVK